MFKKLLVPMDGSAQSYEALKMAISLAKKFEGEITILHVAEVTPYSVMHDDMTMWAAGYFNEMVNKLEEASKEVLRKAKEFALREIPFVKTRMEIGKPVIAICDVAKQEKSDLIVMGNRGMSDLKGFFLGSVSHQVLQRCEQPVLLVKEALVPAGV